MSVTDKGELVPDNLVMPPQLVRQYLETHAVLGSTERTRILDRREAFYIGGQYDHHQYDWWGRSPESSETISPQVTGAPAATVPNLTVRDKKPTIPENTTTTIVNGYSSMIFGEKRQPAVTVLGDPVAEAALKAAMEQAQFWAKWKYARDMAGASGAVCVTTHLRGGRFCLDVHKAKYCKPVWRDRSRWELSGLLKMWSTEEEVDDVDAKGNVVGRKVVEVLHRRIITEAEDVTYVPIVLEDADEVTWEPLFIARHNLGVFPGVWVQNHHDDEDMDGVPDCEGAWQQCDSLDRLMAQTYMGTINNIDPTAVIKYDQTEVALGGGQIYKGSMNAITPGKNGDAKYMETAGTSTAAGLELARELRQVIRRRTRYVMLDETDVSGFASSGTALDIVMRPTTDCADEIRTEFSPAVRRTLELMSAIGARMQGRVVAQPDTGRQVRLALVGLPKRPVKSASGEVQFVDQVFRDGITTSLTWGPYFPPSVQEDGTRVTNATTAKVGGVVSGRTATSYVAKTFGIEDVDAERAAIEQEQADELDAALSEGMREPAPGAAPAAAAGSRFSITPSAQGTIVTVNEARRSLGLPPLPEPEGSMTLAQFESRIKEDAPLASGVPANGAPRGGAGPAA